MLTAAYFMLRDEKDYHETKVPQTPEEALGGALLVPVGQVPAAEVVRR